MYRDDQDAADALADGLKRENAELERENATLKEALAARPAPAPAPARSKKQKKSAKQQRKANRKQAREQANVRSPAYNWMVRAVCGVAVAALSFAITRSIYPALHPGKSGLFPSALGAVINQMWALALIAQPILGWWPNEDADSGYDVLTTRQRALAIGGGTCAIVVSAAFLALVGESSMGV